MFVEMDAEDRGYRQGSEQASSVVKLQLAETLGVDKETIGNLTSREVSSKLVGMRAVFSALDNRIEEEAHREALLVSPDPKDVASVIIAEQIDFFGEDNRGYVSSADYDFVDIEEVVYVRTPIYPNGPLNDPDPEIAEWVVSHLSKLGFDRDIQSAAEIADTISLQVLGEKQ